ncbi:TMhelix containing protein [Vibrio phage 1.121.O._10N.286.46.C4]|nr:TMhelix containing protein [Vibrio phage 1.121.O._10N.286.46.C4]
MKSKSSFNTMICVIGFVLFLVVGGATAIASHLSVDQVTFTVTEKERITTSKESYYLIYDGTDAFKNVDDMWQLKFDSTRLYSTLTVGATFTCTKNFWRVPFLSMYENLLECTEVK